ncbi:MAG: EamA family transporter [Anaerolineales bacterium]|nr:EamA family transporter [Anaerolineales bacterium]MCB9128224.1 EamA family transporter [Ardenticatenales bacterium]
MSNRWRLILSFAAVYLIWGSTYLAIRFAIETIPPLLMAGSRFLIVGALLYAAMRGRGAARPTGPQWAGAALVGGLLFMGGNGGVTWAEQRVPSSLAALLIALMPLWMVALTWLMEGPRPTWRTTLGLALGLLGVALLIGPSELLHGERPDLLGVAVLLSSGFLWALGSLFSRRVAKPASLLMAVAMQNIAGGTLLLLAGTVGGEWPRLNLAAMSSLSLFAFLYLIIFGSIVAFSAYTFLLQNTTPANAATYAYVNPVIALLLGWLLGNEPMTMRVIVAAAVIISAVVLITTRRTAVPKPVPALTTQPCESG